MKWLMPALAGTLVAGAGADPHADRDGAHGPHTLGDDPLSAVERGDGISLHSPHSSSAVLEWSLPRLGGGDAWTLRLGKLNGLCRCRAEP